jgi:hypothetical protein
VDMNQVVNFEARVRIKYHVKMFWTIILVTFMCFEEVQCWC